MHIGGVNGKKHALDWMEMYCLLTGAFSWVNFLHVAAPALAPLGTMTTVSRGSSAC
jgi:hypothetical protein